MEFTKQQREWIDALKSGRYSQTKQYLYDEKGYCCLGVGCDLFVQEHPARARWDGEDGVREIVVDPEDGGYLETESAELPQSVMHWLGLRGYNGEAESGSSLATLNDTGLTFIEIAKLLEDEQENFFTQEGDDDGRD
jgi:hypothetical protein